MLGQCCDHGLVACIANEGRVDADYLREFAEVGVLTEREQVSTADGARPAHRLVLTRLLVDLQLRFLGVGRRHWLGGHWLVAAAHHQREAADDDDRRCPESDVDLGVVRGLWTLPLHGLRQERRLAVAAWDLGAQRFFCDAVLRSAVRTEDVYLAVVARADAWTRRRGATGTAGGRTRGRRCVAPYQDAGALDREERRTDGKATPRDLSTWALGRWVAMLHSTRAHVAIEGCRSCALPCGKPHAAVETPRRVQYCCAAPLFEEF